MVEECQTSGHIIPHALETIGDLEIDMIAIIDEVDVDIDIGFDQVQLYKF